MLCLIYLFFIQFDSPEFPLLKQPWLKLLN